MDESNTVRTILFADVVDSTRLYEELGDEEARRILLECLGLMEETVQSAGGQPVSRIGDEILCSFGNPDDAAYAAGQIHARVVAGLAQGRFPRAMRIRIGFEHGPVLETPEGLFGATVHTAARLVNLAKASQTLTTKDTLQHLSPVRQTMQRFFDRVVLKGQAHEQDIHELLWDTGATIVPTSRPRTETRRTGIRAIELRYGEVLKRLDANDPRLDLGRDSACGLQVQGSAVSRLHARLSWNRGKVRIDDVSTNGTCVEPKGGKTITLHHEGAELTGEGTIRLGCIGPEGSAALVRYVCEDA